MRSNLIVARAELETRLSAGVAKDFLRKLVEELRSQDLPEAVTRDSSCLRHLRTTCHAIAHKRECSAADDRKSWGSGQTARCPHRGKRGLLRPAHADTDNHRTVANGRFDIQGSIVSRSRAFPPANYDFPKRSLANANSRFPVLIPGRRT
jgi:hypothetical protein